VNTRTYSVVIKRREAHTAHIKQTMAFRWSRALLPLLAVASPRTSHTAAAFQIPALGRGPAKKIALPPNKRMSTTATATDDSLPNTVIPGRPTWQQTMLRIKDPSKSLAFYQTLGFTLIDTFHFPQYNFSLYFLTTLPEGESYTLTPGSVEAHAYLWTMEGVALELTHNHGTENDGESFTGYHVGNQERDGFGHVAVKYV
jgi:lactoylglutathione lyase